MDHAAVMEFRRCNSISSAAGDRALGPCSLRNQEKDHDDHFKNSLDRRDRGRGYRIAGIGPVAQSRSRQRQCGGVQLRTNSSQNDEYVVPQSSHAKTAARQNGLRAFASVPGAAPNSGSNDPAFTGGGSAGYNQMLQQY